MTLANKNTSASKPIKPKKPQAAKGQPLKHRTNPATRPEIQVLKNWVAEVNSNPATPRHVLIHLSNSFDILEQFPALMKEAHIVTYSHKKENRGHTLKGFPTQDVTAQIVVPPECKLILLYNCARNLKCEAMQQLKETGLPILCITKTSRTKKRESKNLKETQLGKLHGLYLRTSALGLKHLYTTITNPESAHPAILNPNYAPAPAAKLKAKKAKPSSKKDTARKPSNKPQGQKKPYLRKPKQTPAANKPVIETLYTGNTTESTTKAKIVVQKRPRTSTAAS